MDEVEQLKRRMIEKHLENVYGQVLKSSVDYYAENGKVSGTFFMTIKAMLQEYGDEYKLL